MTQTNVSAQQLKSIIDRIERVSEEIDGLKADVKEIYAEAKGNGFDTKIIRAIVRLRKLSAADRQEMDALMETYMAAIGMEA
jgi:uncharacterized protein (UPF0335 family)